MYNVLKSAAADFVGDRCTRIAAALAYYTAFSLAPTLMVVIAVCQLVFEPSDVRGQVEAEIVHAVGTDGAEQIKSMLKTDTARQQQGFLASATGALVMLMGATGLFAQLQSAMNDVWEVQPDPRRGGVRNFLLKRIMSLGMVLTVSFLILVSMTASAALHVFDSTIEHWLPTPASSLLVQVGEHAVSLGVLCCLFAAMFKWLPDAEVKWSDVWVGAVATAMLFVIGKLAVGLYVGSQDLSVTYGAAGSLVVVLMWVYYSAIIFLFGAELTQAWAKHRGAGIVPVSGAVRVVTRTDTIVPGKV
ncbi:MAG: YihY/virulence factor BrkB family protein [Planctomycetales bacterium]|nr:YihY/virulence factor BrkB family protein [Planctomycetales bacterium]